MASNQPAYAPAPQLGTPGDRDDRDLTERDMTEAERAEALAEALRGKHRLPRQRAVARGTTVIGVAAMAAVGAGGVGGVAMAADAAPAPISLPDAPEVPELPSLPLISDAPAAPGLPDAPSALQATDLPRDLLSVGEQAASTDATSSAASDTTPTNPAPEAGDARSADPGEALRARILGQANQQRDAAAQAERAAAEQAAAAQAAREAAAQKVREQAAAAKAAAEEKAKADAAAAAQEEADRLARLAASYLKPVASYTLTAGFGEVSSLWANTHTGQDFAAPTGTPVHAIHTGTITSAGWAGSYGYRVVLTLADGTELWYCHLSTMVVTSGQVTTGDTIGRVGATGSVTAPHLHLEVRPGGAAPVDPLAWLHAHDITV
ncbi:M23 family metallopeptidase [Streptomyces sp. NPDC051976]|uniref:M23 family metallopeptidase n=1 Tax=Streptomyces sp. NPDC051976 TaxID=3154947 RepID=UPI003447D5A3